jgi:hypothetical protein
MADESPSEHRSRALEQQGETLQRLQRQSSETSEIVARTHRLIEDVRRDLTEVRRSRRDSVPAMDQSPDDLHQEREDAARARLLEWEAADLAVSVPQGGATPREEFACLLYDLVLHADVLGMNTDRLLYHVQYAQNRYSEGR